MSQSATAANAAQTANASPASPFFTPETFMARINASIRVSHADAGRFLKFRVRRVSPNVFPAEQGGKPMIDAQTGAIVMRQIVTTSLWNDSLFNGPEGKAIMAKAKAAWKAGDKQKAHDEFQALENLCSIEYGHLLGRRELPASGRLMEGTLSLVTSKVEGRGSKLVLDGVSPVASETVAAKPKITSLWDDEDDTENRSSVTGETNGLTQSPGTSSSLDGAGDTDFDNAFKGQEQPAA